jgi:hypothetical protein
VPGCPGAAGFRRSGVRGHHDLVARQPVGGHAADQQEPDEGNQEGRGDVAHVAEPPIARTANGSATVATAVPVAEMTSHADRSRKLPLRSGPGILRRVTQPAARPGALATRERPVTVRG